MKNLVVVPAYNEEEALPPTVATLGRLPGEFEILIVNDGSHDATGRIAAELAAKGEGRIHVVHLARNSGIGVAVQTGYLFAQQQCGFEYVIQFDADGQHEASDIPALLTACRQSSLDLCVGSRFLDSPGGTFQSTRLRRLGIRFFARLISFLTGVRVTDPTSGFRCAGPRAWRRFAQFYPEDYPEPESLFWCARNGLRVGEIPSRMHERQGGVSSIRYLRSAYYMLKVTVAILLDCFRGKELR
jgi:glycosyltransferase involved in cell wall biosynthesis